LDQAANRVAAALFDAGGITGDRVAICMAHDAPLMAAALAIAKSGMTGVVLSPGDPLPRLRQLVMDAEPTILLADSAHKEVGRALIRNGSRLLVHEDIEAGGNPDFPDLEIPTDSTAFLTFTSGSSGRPKGVMKSHRHLVHNARRQLPGMGLRPGDRLAVIASLGGGLGLSLYWCGLLAGATVCPFPLMSRGFAGFKRWLDETRVSVLVCSSSVFRSFAQILSPGDHLPHVRLVRLASERATSSDFELFREWFREDCTLLHTLSSSEAGNITAMRWTKQDVPGEGPLPVGRAVEGVSLALVDESGREVPDGEVGEIQVRSRYMASGYWKNQTLTDRCFRAIPDGDGEWEFRGGDLARINEAGDLVYAGRRDSRVKVHGLLVEPAEIEDVLHAQELVERAVVLPRSEGEDAVALLAHVVLRRPCADADDRLRRAVREALPAAMVPSGFVFHEQLPVTPHGKVDRARLDATEPLPTTRSQAPVTRTEQVLAGLWSEALGGRVVGRTDDLFRLGADSLSVAVVAARLPEALGISLAFRAFVDHPTLDALAREIERLRQGGMSAPGPAVAAQAAFLPASFQQESCYRYCADPEAASGYSMSSWYDIHGGLDARLLGASLDEIVRRHEIFRTSLRESPQGLEQVIHPPAPVGLETLDLRRCSNPQHEAERVFRREAARVFDVRAGPFLRFVLLRLGEEHHRLLRMNSHINSDGWTWVVFLRELGVIYESLVKGSSHGLPEPRQYADYALWQRKFWRCGSEARARAVEQRRRELAGGFPLVALPFQRGQPHAEAKAADGHVTGDVPPEVSKRMDELARRVGAWPYVTWLGLLAAQLSSSTGEREMLLGSYISDRAVDAAMDMLGFLAHLTAIRLEGTPAMSFLEWIAEAQRAVDGGQACVGLPHEEVAADLLSLGEEVPNVRMIFRQVLQPPVLRCSGIVFDPAETWGFANSPSAIPWGFTMCFIHDACGNRCAAHFDPRLYDPRQVRRFVGEYVRLLDRASLAPGAPLSSLVADGGGGWLHRLFRRG
jgi:acyl-coenzyme A synthetase/AMP-(fatty) acid ligase/acyl carrier protein